MIDPEVRPPESSIADRGLPWSALLAMAATAFIVIMTETLPAGLMLQISDGLDLSESAAGQLISAYALGAVPSLYRRSRLLVRTGVNRSSSSR